MTHTQNSVAYCKLLTTVTGADYFLCVQSVIMTSQNLDTVLHFLPSTVAALR